jgi:signal transduction histidine kinase
VSERAVSGQDRRSRAGGVEFQGEDRRARAVDSGDLRTRGFAALFLLGVAVLVLAARTSGDNTGGAGARAFEAALAATAITVAALASAATLLDWRLTGATRAFRIAVAIPLLAIGAPGLSRLLPLVAPGWDGTVVRAASEATVLVAIGLFALALLRPEVDTKLRPRYTIGVTLALIVALTDLFALLPGVKHSLEHGASIGPVPLHALGAAALVALAAGYWFRGVRSERQLLTWIALLLFGYALAAVVTPAESSTHGFETGLAIALAVLATMCALIGGARELARGYVEQRRARFDAELNAEMAQTRFRTERAEREEQLHDTRSAVLAIQAATRMLEHRMDSFRDDERELVTSAITAELERVQEITGVEPAASEPERFSIRSALLPLVICQRARNRTIFMEIPTGLIAVARPAAVVEIVQNLVDNAAHHAPGSSITLRTVDGDDCVHLHVDDRGAGVPPDAREEIFKRGVTTGGAPGGGIGLFVSQRLARENDADLWVEDRSGGGASFVLALPIPVAADALDADASEVAFDADLEFDPSDPTGDPVGTELFEEQANGVDVMDVDFDDLLNYTPPSMDARPRRHTKLEHRARPRG